MKHVMIDLETLGTVPGCSILSIGAVEFLPATGKLGKEFYAVVSTPSCEEHFLTTSEDTVAWWSRQSAEARTVLEEARTGGQPLPEALEGLNSFLRSVGGIKEVLVYGNGADFDNPILACAYDAAKVKCGWASYNGRCYRTLKNLHELLGESHRAHKLTARSGTYHNALDDAKSQATHLLEVLARIKG